MTPSSSGRDRRHASRPLWLMRAAMLPAALMLSCLLGASLTARSATLGLVPSGCTSIQDVPVSYTIDYNAAVQGLFNSFDGQNGCIDCHFEPPGSSGNLDLTGGHSWFDLVNVPSDESGSIDYVVPGHPEQSLLFQKLNCNHPAVGGRMPRNAANLSPEQQALIYDWIAAGAPVATTDGIFRATFDTRGFDQ